MRIHFIAIGGAIMHQLSIALHLKGLQVSGSDDRIFDPAKSNLEQHGLLPDAMGFFAERITPELDGVILGMHAKADNPELLRAQELGIKVWSFPEYVYEHSKDKTRVVIAGSHGKTTITSMVMHILQACGMSFDYLVGAKLEGFEYSVQLSDAPIMVIEGDEYLASPLQRVPKFDFYHPHIALMSGIAWDHFNVFPSFENYCEQFQRFAQNLDTSAHFVYMRGDHEVVECAHRSPAILHPYHSEDYQVKDGKAMLEGYPMAVIGAHNMQNLAGAVQVATCLGIEREEALKAAQSFTGAARRMELVHEQKGSVVYKDFAHSPSKVKATTDALKNHYPKRKLVACLELHTFSSLNRAFIDQYEGALAAADIPIVFYDHQVVQQKGMGIIKPEEMKRFFNDERLLIYSDKSELLQFLSAQAWTEKNLLMMSSGNFKGLSFKELVTLCFE